MKVRHKICGDIAYSGNFNIHSYNEIIVTLEEGDMDSDYIDNYEVFLNQKNEWKNLRQAFKDNDVITDNYNTRFFEPPTEADRVRGYTL